MARYEVLWQVYGVHELEAESDRQALDETQEWLDDESSLSSAQICDGIDLEAKAVLPR